VADLQKIELVYLQSIRAKFKECEEVKKAGLKFNDIGPIK
jgi:hypothetical protein